MNAEKKIMQGMVARGMRAAMADVFQAAADAYAGGVDAKTAKVVKAMIKAAISRRFNEWYLKPIKDQIRAELDNAAPFSSAGRRQSILDQLDAM